MSIVDNSLRQRTTRTTQTVIQQEHFFQKEPQKPCDCFDLGKRNVLTKWHMLFPTVMYHQLNISKKGQQ